MVALATFFLVSTVFYRHSIEFTVSDLILQVELCIFFSLLLLENVTHLFPICSLLLLDPSRPFKIHQHEHMLMLSSSTSSYPSPHSPSSVIFLSFRIWISTNVNIHELMFTWIELKRMLYLSIKIVNNMIWCDTLMTLTEAHWTPSRPGPGPGMEVLSTGSGTTYTYYKQNWFVIRLKIWNWLRIQ